MATIDDVLGAIDAGQTAALDRLFAFLSIPSISAANVPDVLSTTRSPSSKKRGSSEKCECTSVPSAL